MVIITVSTAQQDHPIWLTLYSYLKSAEPYNIYTVLLDHKLSEQKGNIIVLLHASTSATSIIRSDVDEVKKKPSYTGTAIPVQNNVIFFLFNT